MAYKPTPLELAISIAGTQAELAAQITAIMGPSLDGIELRQQNIAAWLAKGIVPPKYCRAIEQATKGIVTRYQLRPDMFGDPDDVITAATGTPNAG